ncbi:hypothetical protein [Pararhizobium qamdonense]|uniref:hypothetical protein n=1 Tax=Pararhizobium qamdonense TaxID=3031126 RepID=UPI0023E3119F|nr:hypothetical protein [Pararhizobium qamdonense]
MGVFDFLNPKKKKPTDGNDLEAVVNPAAKEKQNFLSQFLPEDDTKKQALAQALLLGGAGLMSAAGPSVQPSNFLSSLGQGIGSGVVGYNKSLENSSDTMNARTASNANNAKMQQAQTAVQFASSIGSPNGQNGYSIEQLQKIFEYQVQSGDDAGARDTLGMIQKLSQTAAAEGMVIGEDGSYRLADGYAGGLFDTKRAESLGTAVGANSQKTASQKDFEYSNANPAFRENELLLKQAGVAQPDNKFFGKSAEKAAERFAGYQEQGLKSSELTNNVGRMAELSKNIGTGKWAEIKKTVGPWAQAVGVDVVGMDEIQAFEAMVSAVAPQMRVPGSGATSDFDANQFLKALPSMANTPEGNALIARTTTAIEQNKVKAAEIANRVYDSEDPLFGRWQDAEKEINALPDPFTEFREARGGGNTSPDTTGSVQPSADNAVVVGSEAEYNKLPAGATYRFAGDPVGTMRTKR